MKTILSKEIDGHNIIIGFSRPSIDPVATREVVEPLLYDTPEVKQIGQIDKEIGDIRKLARASRDSYKIAYENRDKKMIETHEDDIKRYRIMIEEKLTELYPLKKQLEIKKREFTISKAVYFEPKKGENIISDEIAGELCLKTNALDKGQKLNVEGFIVPDYRGKIYHLKGSDGWSVKKIETLGEIPESGAVEASKLTPDQRSEIAEQANAKRIIELSTIDKQTEKIGIIDSLAGQAAMMRSKLEIQGTTVSKALTDSRAWYETEVSKVDLIYA